MKTIVSFSGGQDSTTILFYALTNADEVYTIGFDYGQRHKVELECRKKILEAIPKKFPQFAHKLKGDTIVNAVPFGQVVNSALTHAGEIKAQKGELPSSFVPARNLLFMAIAGGYAYSIGADSIMLGVSEEDYSGYPDCREKTIKAMQAALECGLDKHIEIICPLMHLSKAKEWKLAEELGGNELVSFIVENSHTCYEGDHSHLHEWGYGCGKCPACILREKGFNEYKKGETDD